MTEPCTSSGPWRDSESSDRIDPVLRAELELGMVVEPSTMGSSKDMICSYSYIGGGVAVAAVAVDGLGDDVDVTVAVGDAVVVVVVDDDPAVLVLVLVLVAVEDNGLDAAVVSAGEEGWAALFILLSNPIPRRRLFV